MNSLLLNMTVRKALSKHLEAASLGIRPMNVLCFGGGTDSTAILCGWVEFGLQEIDPIDRILFADTGGERPWTYEHIERMNTWLLANGMPEITVVRYFTKYGRHLTLEEDLLEKFTLPPVVFGFKSCSQKFKIRPQNKFLNNDHDARAIWAAGGKVNKLIGYEFSETRRWMNKELEDGKYTLQFPLVEWQWNRSDCVAAIHRAGIVQPGKSSCFFCPSSKKPEIDELRSVYPDLYERAVAMENNAKETLAKRNKVKGLGRHFSWLDYAGAPENTDPVCMYCVD